MLTLEQNERVDIPDSWAGLNDFFVELRPIKSDEDHAAYMEALNTLLRIENPSSAVSDYIAVLAKLIEGYEQSRWPIDTSEVTVIDILQSFLEDHHMTRDDLGLLLGKDRTLGCKIMTGKRKLTTAQVKILANHFKVSADLFI